MEINAVIFPFPAVLQLYGRIAFGDGELCEPTMHFHTQFSPININTADTPGCRSQFAISEGDAYAHKYTAGINKLRLWASLVNPYCAKHNLPSPTDSVSRFPVPDLPSPTDSRFTVFVRFIANRFRVIAYPWTRIFASILPENQPPYGVLVDF